MAISESEIEGTATLVKNVCVYSGTCVVFKNGNNLTIRSGDKELCFISQEEGRDINKIRKKIRDALQ